MDTTNSATTDLDTSHLLAQEGMYGFSLLDCEDGHSRWWPTEECETQEEVWEAYQAQAGEWRC